MPFDNNDHSKGKTVDALAYLRCTPGSLHIRSHSIRVVTLAGTPWFVGVDCRDILNLAKHGKLFSFLDDSEKMVITREVAGEIGPHLFMRSTAKCFTLISESGLYKLIMRSDKPQAKAFQDWVTKEVLPSIRKTGSFVTGQPSLIENPQMDPPKGLGGKTPGTYVVKELVYAYAMWISAAFQLKVIRAFASPEATT